MQPLSAMSACPDSSLLPSCSFLLCLQRKQQTSLLRQEEVQRVLAEAGSVRVELAAKQAILASSVSANQDEVLFCTGQTWTCGCQSCWQISV